MGSPAPAPSPSPRCQRLPWEAEQALAQASSLASLENKLVHVTRSECAWSRDEPRRCRAPLHRHSHRHTDTVSCQQRELSPGSHEFLGEGTQSPAGLFVTILLPHGEMRCAAVPAPEVRQGLPLPSCPRGCGPGTQRCPSPCSWIRPMGRERAGNRTSSLWGCSGRAAEEMPAVVGCRGSKEAESWFF